MKNVKQNTCVQWIRQNVSVLEFLSKTKTESSFLILCIYV